MICKVNGIEKIFRLLVNRITGCLLIGLFSISSFAMNGKPNESLTPLQSQIRSLYEARYQSPGDFNLFAKRLLSLGVVRQTYDVMDNTLAFYSDHGLLYQVSPITGQSFVFAPHLKMNRLKLAIDNIDHNKISAASFHQELARVGVVYVSVYLKQHKIYYFGQDGQYYLETY